MENENMVEEEAVVESAPAAAAADNGERSERSFAPKAMRNRRKKVCPFCADKIAEIDYKDTKRLIHLVSERSKILPRRVSGCCALHQRQLTVAVKRARMVALLPYISD